MKLYCKSCGSATDYTINKPKFCANCGNSFLENKILPKKINLSKDTYNEDVEDEESEANLESIKNISNLDYEISTYEKPKQTIGDLVGTSNGQELSNNPDIPQKKISRKEFLEQFSREAGSLRGKNRTRKRDV